MTVTQEKTYAVYRFSCACGEVKLIKIRAGRKSWEKEWEVATDKLRRKRKWEIVEYLGFKHKCNKCVEREGVGTFAGG